MARLKRTYRLNEDTITRIDRVADEQGISKEKAIEFVFQKFTEQEQNETKLVDKLHETVMTELKKVREDLSRIRGASNNIDRHTQMQIEFWNHFFVANPAKELVSTDKFKRKEVIEADALIKQRIATLRQKKIDHEKR